MTKFFTTLVFTGLLTSLLNAAEIRYSSQINPMLEKSDSSIKISFSSFEYGQRDKNAIITAYTQWRKNVTRQNPLDLRIIDDSLVAIAEDSILYFSAMNDMNGRSTTKSKSSIAITYANINLITDTKFKEKALSEIIATKDINHKILIAQIWENLDSIQKHLPELFSGVETEIAEKSYTEQLNITCAWEKIGKLQNRSLRKLAIVIQQKSWALADRLDFQGFIKDHQVELVRQYDSVFEGLKKTSDFGEAREIIISLKKTKKK